VTGGCGFIGSHLADALIADGHSVVILDNLSTGKRANAHPAATLIVGDTTDYATVERAFDGIDGCFHLAAIASVEKSIHEWTKTHTTNVTSTVNIFQASSRMGKIPVVYTSSAAVYGNAKTVPTHEKVATNPLTAYGVDKLGCDLHGSVASSVHGVPNIGLRPFNVYGPRQDPSSPYSGVISIFVNHVKQGLPVTIFGDGQQVRDFVFVGDAVLAFVAAMGRLQDKGRNAGHDVINICTGRPTSINYLLRTISEIAGRSLEYNYGPERTGDIRISIGDPSRLHMRLKLELQTTLSEGLSTFVEHVPAPRESLFVTGLAASLAGLARSRISKRPMN
jgi:UDP-glucose 4-epimerase